MRREAEWLGRTGAGLRSCALGDRFRQVDPDVVIVLPVVAFGRWKTQTAKKHSGRQQGRALRHSASPQIVFCQNFRLERLSGEEPLDLGAALPGEPLELRIGFHTLGNDIDP